MKFHFENLGLLDQVDLELADLTLICGENNTGKTYAMFLKKRYVYLAPVELLTT